MANNIRDLAEWYPFIPEQFPAGTQAAGNEPPALAAVVLDMRILVALDASDTVYGLAFTGESAVDRIELTSISGSTAVVRCHGQLWEEGHADIDLDVLVGRDMRGKPETSYIVMSEYRSFSGSLDVHPDCLMFMQRAPRLDIWTRHDVNVHEQPVSPGERLPSGDIGLADGNNVGVEWDGSGISWNGVAGAGAGIWLYPPYNGGSYYIMHGSVGMRSVNGMSEVVIEGSPTVSVTAALEDNDDIVLTIRPNYEEDEEDE